MNRMLKKDCFFELSEDAENIRITLTGEIDHHSAVRVRTAIDALIFEKRPRRLILNLENIDFMDSSGLGLIMGRLGKMQSVGGELWVEDPNERILKIFMLAGLEKKVKIVVKGEEK